MLKITINYGLKCEVDYKKCDCRQEPAHCHITKNGIRVAQVWLNPVCLKFGHSLDRSEAKEVTRFVESHLDELKREYEYNREHGAAY